MRTKIALIAVGVVLVAVISTIMIQRSGKEADTIQIAGNLPLSGPVAAFSGNYPKGFLMGLDSACVTYGVDRQLFNVDFQDNAGKASQSASVFQKHKLSGFDVYIHGTTEASLAIVDQVDAAPAPQFLVAFDAYMARRGDNRFRVLPNFKAEASLWVSYAKKRNAKRIFMITLNMAGTEEQFSTLIEPALHEAGIVTQRETYDFAVSDWRTLVLKSKSFNPDIIFFNGYSAPHVKPAIAALRELNMVDNGNVMVSTDFVDLLYTDMPREELAGIAFACPGFEITGKVEGVAEWKANYEKRYGIRPTYIEAYAYDTATLIVKATSSANGQPLLGSIRKSLPFFGVTGEINLDQDGDVVASMTAAEVLLDGTVVNLLD